MKRLFLATLLATAMAGAFAETAPATTAPDAKAPMAKMKDAKSKDDCMAAMKDQHKKMETAAKGTDKMAAADAPADGCKGMKDMKGMKDAKDSKDAKDTKKPM